MCACASGSMFDIYQTLYLLTHHTQYCIFCSHGCAVKLCSQRPSRAYLLTRSDRYKLYCKCVQVSIQAGSDLDKQLKAALQVRGDGTGVT